MKFVVAVVTSAALVLVAPFMGQVQLFLRESLSTEQYVLLFGVAVAGPVAGAIVTAFLRVRERRLQRFAIMTVALLLAAAYMAWTATPWPEVNAVERVHFVTYGAIAFLFYRAWRPAGDLSIVVLPLLAAFVVGTLDEWLQWFIPVRVGEAHDVFLNLVSIACGLVFAISLQPPASFSFSLTPSTLARVGWMASASLLVFASFLSTVHLGHVIAAAGIGEFRSRYTEAELYTLQAIRAEQWKTDPPTTLRRLSREDQYLDEGVWHIRHRNRSAGHEQWRENLILERYFASVLDTPTYASPQGNRWPAEQRANAEAALTMAPQRPYVSAANPYPIYAWPKVVYWPVVIVLALMLAGGPLVLRGREADRSP